MRKTSILAVDDSATVRSLLSEVLTRSGYQVYLSASGEEALDLLAQVHVDLALVDLKLPGMDGISLCRRIKDLSPKDPLPVVMLTAKSNLEDKLAGFEAGADDFVLKPFRHRELLARIDVQMRILSLRRELDRKRNALERAQVELRDHLLDLEESHRQIEAYKARTERDLELASKVQHKLLAHELPRYEEVEIETLYLPARSVGGDFYEALELPDGRLGLAVGDVAGKGAAASLLMVLMLTELRLLAPLHLEPVALLRALHEHLLANYGPETMVTMFYGIFDPASFQLDYALAGHEPPIWLRGQSPKAVPCPPGGPFLGIFPDWTGESHRIDLGPGDQVLVFSDGLVDRFADLEAEAALGRVAQRLSRVSPQGFMQWVRDLPANPTPVEDDDLTCLLVRRQPKDLTGC